MHWARAGVRIQISDSLQCKQRWMKRWAGQTLGNYFSSPPRLHPFWVCSGQQPGQVNRSGWVWAGRRPAVWVAVPSFIDPLSPPPPFQHHWVHPSPLLTGLKPRSDERFSGRGWPSEKMRLQGPFSLGRAHDWILLKPPPED